MISALQRPLPDNTQHSQQTNIHALGVIRTHNLSRRAAVDLRLRPRGHWDRPTNIITVSKSRKMRWIGHVALMGKRRGGYRVLMGTLKKKHRLEHRSVDGKDKIKMDFKDAG